MHSCPGIYFGCHFDLANRNSLKMSYITVTYAALKVCIRTKWPALQAGALCPLNHEAIRSKLLPLDGILVHRRVTPSIMFVHLHGERHCEIKVPCPRTQHKVPCQGSKSGPLNPETSALCANHKATALLMHTT